MLNSEREEHQVHGLVGGHVVVVQLLLDGELQFLGIQDLLVELFGADWGHDVGP